MFRKFFTLGFSLLEILIVIAILGILASIAMPIYHHHLIKAQRSDAQITLLSLATAMEHYYLKNHSYIGATLGDHGTISTTNTSFNRYYHLMILVPTATSYVLSATPIDSQAKDTQCGILSINQLGVKMISGKGTLNECW